MLYLAENLRKYRLAQNLTQEDIAGYLNITAQAVSKWERNESFPDITFLPTLANILNTSVDLLLGMDTIRAKETRYNIHSKATDYQRNGDYAAAEKVYRDALLIYPNKPGMILGLAGVLALQCRYEESAELIEKGLPLSSNEKQKATMRALLCYLYLACGMKNRACDLASTLPHTRESREAVLPVVEKGLDSDDLTKNIHLILLGE